MSDNERKTRGRIKQLKVLMPVPITQLELPIDYSELLDRLKQRVRKQKLQVIQEANKQLVMLYWFMGSEILKRQDQTGWGAKIIDRLSYDLRVAFPEMSGFSPRNLKYMRKFAQVWPDPEFVQRTVAQIQWGSNITLIERLDVPEMRLWYASKILEHGWSRDMLQVQIESKLHLRQGAANNNFPQTLPPQYSDMAIQAFKDPYLFDFLGTDTTRREAELEQKLIEHVEHFLLELGQGFAFVGRQVHLEVADEDFYIDLLFYHLKLRCYVVIELKAGKFKPGDVSQLNMYQTLVDQQLRHSDDQPTIGLLLVKEKNQVIVEYALASYNKPIGVAQWQQLITQSLPEELKSSLPTIEQIEREFKDDNGLFEEYNRDKQTSHSSKKMRKS